MPTLARARVSEADHPDAGRQKKERDYDDDSNLRPEFFRRAHGLGPLRRQAMIWEAGRLRHIRSADPRTHPLIPGMSSKASTLFVWGHHVASAKAPNSRWSATVVGCGLPHGYEPEVPNTSTREGPDVVRRDRCTQDIAIQREDSRATLGFPLVGAAEHSGAACSSS
jgi:hypothetical protein